MGAIIADGNIYFVISRIRLYQKTILNIWRGNFYEGWGIDAIPSLGWLLGPCLIGLAGVGRIVLACVGLGVVFAIGCITRLWYIN